MDFADDLKIPEILIVDDSPEQIQSLASILRHGNYIVHTLTDGKQVFKYLKKGIPDIIILDIMMPDIDGFEICRMLRMEKKYSNIPVIFVTAADTADYIIKGFQAGAQDYLVKPVNPDVLMVRTKAQIELKQKNDRIRRAYKEIEVFNHIISHDLKAPLWDIQKLVKYIMDAKAVNDNDAEEELLSVLNEKAEETVVLVEKLSQLTKMSSVPLKIEAIDMYKLVKETYSEMITYYADRDIRFNCDLLPIVFGDRVLLKQVLKNILSNALKYTKDRKPAVISVGYSKSGMEYVFSIKDNGVGFDMKYAGKLFGMFQRLHSQQEFEGTGAGLAIVKKIIERHSGRVWIKAEPDKGAVLSFTLPRRVSSYL